MKIDMHTHCQPASECAHFEPELLPEKFKNAGIDAIVLTNNYDPLHYLVQFSRCELDK